jgi:hypothetical protein
MRWETAMLHRTMVVGMVLLAFSTSTVRAADEAAKPSKDKATNELIVPAERTPWADAKHFINKWLLLGPFVFGAKDFGGGQQTAAADKEFMPKEAELDGTQEPPQDAKGVKWQARDYSGARVPGEITPANLEHAATYAVAWVKCPEAITNAALLVGSDDYAKVWINGKLVYTYKAGTRAGEADQDEVTGVNLNKGENRIVVKCVNALGGWSFYIRFTDKNGKAYAVKMAAESK